MSRFRQIDLSKVPPPDVVHQLDYEALLSEMKDALLLRDPSLAASLELESEPLVKLLQVCAEYRLRDRAMFNDGVRACMLSHATGADLDNLVTFWGVQRLIIQEAQPNAVPPVPEVLEDDEALRDRTVLAMEAQSSAGPIAGYEYFALSADGDVRDVSVSSPEPGVVQVVVLSHSNNGAPTAALMASVTQAVNGRYVRPLCDTVTVAAANILTYDIDASLTLYPGPDASVVETACRTSLDRYIAGHHKLGHDITRSGLYAALHLPGVQNVTLNQPAADLVVADHQAAYCAAPALSVGGVDV